ncbi:MAG: riboflavin biosynthesis protein RibF [Ruminococcus sp.]|nr:riboflavin biosynthesis protein RibF [Ruminococcus sp.]
MDKTITSVALGLFDGVHIGHRAVIGAACAQRQNGLTPAVFTFQPEGVLRKSGGLSGYIYTQNEKEILLRELIGSGTIFSPPFEELRSLTGEDFAQTVLAGQMRAAHVCCGADFRFGRNASCGAEELIALGRRYGFSVQIVESVRQDGRAVSSSRIRELLLEGDVQKAGELLGAPYFLSARVEDGNRIGRTISFPTINQRFCPGRLVPRYGAYATTATVEGRELPSVTNVGIKPTVGGESEPLAETHIIGYSGDLYGKTVDVAFRSFIRPELKFSSLEELRAQIRQDIASAT